MKKKIIIPAILFAVFLLAGCGKGDQKGDGEMPGKDGEKGNSAEFVSACSGKSEGDSCEMSMPQKDSSALGGKISGTCRKTPSGELSCMPQQGGGPQGQGSQGQGMKGQGPVQE